MESGFSSADTLKYDIPFAFWKEVVKRMFCCFF